MFPTVIATSVIRAAQQHETHGGVYRIDLETGRVENPIVWDDRINFDGRGLERGLRGIAFHGDRILLASSRKLHVFDQRFREVESYSCEYLLALHEISVLGHRAYLTSTGYDSLIEFDLESEVFTRGLCLRDHRVQEFDPERGGQVKEGDTLHLNNVHCSDEACYFSGARGNTLFEWAGDQLEVFARIPLWSHNPRPHGDGVLLNDTPRHQVLYQDRGGKELATFPVQRFAPEELLPAGLDDRVAVPGWARGICTTADGRIIGGSSPANVTVFEPGVGAVRNVTITRDVRTCIHGLEVWPFDPAPAP